MKTLLFSTLFPNNAQPNFGIFVENRLQQLQRSGKVDTKVIAPVPWFPLKHQYFGKYAQYANVLRHELRDKTDIYHPRYLVLPKIGMNISPDSLFRSALPIVRRIISRNSRAGIS